MTTKPRDLFDWILIISASVFFILSSLIMLGGDVSIF